MPFNVERMIADLRVEKDLLDRAIEALERLPQTGPRQKGRPRKLPKSPLPPTHSPRANLRPE
jgi:hypothetical protein